MYPSPKHAFLSIGIRNEFSASFVSKEIWTNALVHSTCTGNFPSMIQRLTVCSVAGHCTVCCSSEAIELKDIKNFERALVVRVNNWKQSLGVWAHFGAVLVYRNLMLVTPRDKEKNG